MYLRDVEINKAHIEDKIFILDRRFKSLLEYGDKFLLSFSCGKDSEVLLQTALLAGYKDKMTIVHYALLPELSYNEEVLQFFEQENGISIIRYPSPITAKMRAGDLLCMNRIWDLKADKAVPFRRAEKAMMLQSKADFNLIGIKRGDSPIRQRNIAKFGWCQQGCKKAYPLYDWSDREVWMAIKYFNLPINRCYEMFGRSQDVVNFDHIYPLKEQSPEDYQRFVREFPLIEPMVWLYEKNR